MIVGEFLHFVIEDGMETARLEGTGAGGHLRRSGAIEGFADCRGVEPETMAALLKRTEADRNMHADSPLAAYYEWRWISILWVCGVLSALLLANGRPTIVSPTFRATMKAFEITDGEQAHVGG